MRKILSGLVLVGAVVLPLSLARAGTEVMRLPANNTFANIISNDPVTGVSTGIFVTRHKTDRGGPVDTLFYIISRPDFTFSSGGGVLPQGAFHVDGRGASLDVDVNDMVLDSQEGEIPGDGIISAEWSKTGVVRDSGSFQFNFPPIHVLFVGTAAQATCDVAANAFGVQLAGTNGDIRTLTQAVIIISKD
jgi:hypothetical protein